MIQKIWPLALVIPLVFGCKPRTQGISALRADTEQSQKVGVELEFVDQGYQGANRQRQIEILNIIRNIYGSPDAKITSGVEPRHDREQHSVVVNGKTWRVSQEWVGERWIVERQGGPDGYELISPPLAAEEDFGKFFQIVDAVQSKMDIREGLLSSAHFTLDISHLVPGYDGVSRISSDTNVDAVVNLMLYIESHWREIYSAVSPMHTGTIVNRFAVPQSMLTPELFEQLAALPAEERTYKTVRRLFKKFSAGRSTEVDGHKLAGRFKAGNYLAFFDLDQTFRPTFEFRLGDFKDASGLELDVNLLRVIVNKGAALHAASVEAGRKPDFRSLPRNTLWAASEAVGQLSAADYESFLKELLLGQESYPKLGRIGGVVHQGISNSRIEAMARSLPKANKVFDTTFVVEANSSDLAAIRPEWLRQIEAAFAAVLTVEKPNNPLARVTVKIVGGSLEISADTAVAPLEPLLDYIKVGIANPDLTAEAVTGHGQDVPERYQEYAKTLKLKPDEVSSLVRVVRNLGMPDVLWWQKAPFLSVLQRRSVRDANERLFRRAARDPSRILEHRAQWYKESRVAQFASTTLLVERKGEIVDAVKPGAKSSGEFPNTLPAGFDPKAGDKPKSRGSETVRNVADFRLILSEGFRRQDYHAMKWGFDELNKNNPELVTSIIREFTKEAPTFKYGEVQKGHLNVAENLLQLYNDRHFSGQYQPQIRRLLLDLAVRHATEQSSTNDLLLWKGTGRLALTIVPLLPGDPPDSKQWDVYARFFMAALKRVDIKTEKPEVMKGVFVLLKAAVARLEEPADFQRLEKIATAIKLGAESIPFGSIQVLMEYAAAAQERAYFVKGKMLEMAQAILELHRVHRLPYAMNLRFIPEGSSETSHARETYFWFVEELFHHMKNPEQTAVTRMKIAEKLLDNISHLPENIRPKVFETVSAFVGEISEMSFQYPGEQGVQKRLVGSFLAKKDGLGRTLSPSPVCNQVRSQYPGGAIFRVGDRIQ